MKESIFEYDHYRAYLEDVIQSRPSGGHGFRTLLAKAAHTQSAYISQVLNGKADLSMEQGEYLNRFLGHNYLESEFFLLLIQSSRASTPELRERIQIQILEIRSERTKFKQRIEYKTNVTEQDQITYYSHWYYSAIHIACTIPALRTREALADHLGLGVERVNDVLEFLLSCGLVEKVEGKFEARVNRLFLDNDSKMLARHHANWRTQALKSLDRHKDADLHFSGVFSLAKSDVIKIKELLIQSVNKVRGLVKPSKEEEVHSLTLDFFEVSKRP